MCIIRQFYWLTTLFKITSPEDQSIFILPLNRDTEKIYYDHRFIIDAPVLTEPRTFEVSKVNRMSPNGLCKITLAQNVFNDQTDYIEIDEDGNVIGMWADYYKLPQPVDPVRYGEITYSGSEPFLKLRGSYKKLTADTSDTGRWSFEVDNKEISSLLDIVTDGLEPNQVKIKFIGDNTYIGKTLYVVYVTANALYKVALEIKSL